MIILKYDFWSDVWEHYDRINDKLPKITIRKWLEFVSDVIQILPKNEEENQSTNLICKLAYKLAHNATKDELIQKCIINSEEEMYDNNDEATVYTKDAKILSDRWYDYFYDMIKKAKDEIN